ncbi:MAG: hypothetical protein PHC92_11230, partial [Syntrophomonadaceae bacterium]|nr:hypothetical protein [Syntrophomonadaceae bacterium]
MNRRMAGSFIIVLLVFIVSIFNYRSDYIRIPMDESVKTVAKEKAVNLEIAQEKPKIPEKSHDDLTQGTSSSPNIEEKVQLPEKVAEIKLPATKEVTIPVNQAQPVINESVNTKITVSRGTG